jgi:hypothetical protein
VPAESLRALKNELHPNVSVRALEAAAGLPAGYVAYYLKPSTVLKNIDPDVMKEIARCFQTDVLDVVECFAADLGLPWGPDQTYVSSVKRLARVLGVEMDVIEEISSDPQLREHIRDRRRLDARDREALHRMCLALAGGPADGPAHIAPSRHGQAH